MEPEPDFGDLVSCIVSFFLDAKDTEVEEKATELLYGAASASNKREFVRLKLFAEIEKEKSNVNVKVSKLTYQNNKQLNVLPRHKSYHKVDTVAEVLNISPRLSQLCSMKSFTNSLSFIFFLSDSHSLDHAFSELIQAQSFLFSFCCSLPSFPSSNRRISLPLILLSMLNSLLFFPRSLDHKMSGLWPYRPLSH